MDKASEIAVARDEGEKKGIEKGLIEGEKKGIEKGAQQKMKELAQNMRNQGFEDTVIAKCLNMSIEALNALCAL